MNIGDHLDEAAAAIARATAALRDHRPHDPDEQAAVAVARTRLYEELRRQVTLVGDPESSHTGLVTSLRAATAAVRAALPVQLPDAPSAGPISRAVTHAANAIVTVNTALAGHLGIGRPPTPEGVALRTGFGRADNLAATARLVGAAVELDTRLITDDWLRPARDAGSWLPLLMAAGTDVTRTEHGDLAIQALRVATRGNAAEAPSRRVNANPITGDQPWRWQLITSSRLLIDALDAARASLLTDGRNLTTTETARMARSAVIITYQVGHILTNTTAMPDLVTERTHRAVKRWRTANAAAGMLRSPARLPAGGYTADNALRAVADWMSRILGPPHAWQPVARWPTLRAGQHWDTLASEIGVRLPEIALLMSEQVVRAQDAGEILRAQALYRAPNKLIHLVQWDRAPADDPIFRMLRNSLQRAFDAGTDLADLTAVKRPVGIIDAVNTLRELGRNASIRQVINDSFATPAASRRPPSSQVVPGIRWSERHERHR